MAPERSGAFLFFGSYLPNFPDLPGTGTRFFRLGWDAFALGGATFLDLPLLSFTVIDLFCERSA